MFVYLSFDNLMCVFYDVIWCVYTRFNKEMSLDGLNPSLTNVYVLDVSGGMWCTDTKQLIGCKLKVASCFKIQYVSN